MDGLSNPTFESPIFLSVTQGALGAPKHFFQLLRTRTHDVLCYYKQNAAFANSDRWRTIPSPSPSLTPALFQKAK